MDLSLVRVAFEIGWSALEIGSSAPEIGWSALEIGSSAPEIGAAPVRDGLEFVRDWLERA